jgi:hypothetical protein
LEDAWRALPKAAVKNFDTPDFKRAAGGVLQAWEARAKSGDPVRGDFLNMLRIMSEKGLQGLFDAKIDPKEFLPVLVAGGLASALTSRELRSGAGGTTQQPTVR